MWYENAINKNRKNKKFPVWWKRHSLSSQEKYTFCLIILSENTLNTALTEKKYLELQSSC